MSLDRESFVIIKNEFESRFYSSVCSDEIIHYLRNIFDFIEKNGETPKEIGEDLEKFLNNFCSPILLKILDSYAANFSDIKKAKEVLILFSKLYASIIVRPENDNFIDSNSLLYLKENSKIYSTTKLQRERKISELEIHETEEADKLDEEDEEEDIREEKHSELYINVLSVFLEEEFQNSLKKFLNDFESVSYRRMITLMLILQLIDNIGLSASYISSLIDSFIHCFEEKSKFFVDEKEEIYYQKALEKINEIALNKEEENRIKVSSINHEVVTIMEKNESIPNIIRSLNDLAMETEEENKKNLSLIISETKFVDKYMENCGKKNIVFADTIRDFSVLISQFLKYRLVNENGFRNLWNATVAQDEETIHEFFKGWKYLLRNAQDFVSDELFSAIVENGFYNETILSFMFTIKNTASDKSKNAVFRQISELYFETTTPSELYVSVICAYLPTNDQNFLKKMQNKCIKFINMQENVDLAVPLLNATINSITSDEAKEFFQSVSNVSHSDALPLISKLISFFSGELKSDEFEKLNSIVDKLAESHMKDVCDFLMDIFSLPENHFSQEMILEIFKTLSKPEKVAPTVDIVSKMHSLLKDEMASKFLDVCWDCLFRTGSEELSLFMVKLFVYSPDASLISTFVEKCTDNIDTPGSLISLANIIHFVEDGVDRQLNRFIPVNQFVSDDECMFIKLIGYVDTTIRIPRNLSFKAFKDRVSSLIKVSSPVFSLISKDTVVTADSFNLTNCSIFEVKVWRTVPFVPPNPPIFPSQMLAQEKYSDKLFDIMIRNDDTLSPLALKVLNLMPTLESQNQILRTFGSTPQQWASFLSFNSKYLLLYRLNLIGSIVASDHSEWINFFYSTGGAKVLLGIIIFMSRKIFKEDNELLFLLRVAKIVVNQKHWEQYKKEMWESFDTNVLTVFVQFAIDYNESAEILSNLMVILSKFDANILNSLSNFVSLFNLAIFHPNKEVRIQIALIVSQLTPKQQAELLMPLLGESISKESDKYFELLNSVAEVVDHPEGLWNPTIDLLFSLYYPPQTTDNLEKLMYEPADAIFAQRLFVILDKLTAKYEVIPNQEKLCSFIIQDILFNGIKYYEPTRELFDIISKIMAQNNGFREQICQKLALTHNVVQTIPLNAPELKLASNCKNRGISNMGSTSYLSSLFQVFFGSKQFVKIVLSQNTGVDWFFEFQRTLCNLLFSPSKFISIYKFVDTFRGLNGRSINVLEFTDIAEFYKSFVKMIFNVCPAATKCFRGEIRKYTTKKSNEKTETSDRYFTVIPIDITKSNNVEDGLKNYFKPENYTEANETTNSYEKIRKTPKILAIQLKRIVLDPHTGKKVKINKEFSYPHSIDIADLLDGPLRQSEYDLYGIVTYNGDAERGKFEAYIKQEKGEWINFDDQNVIQVDNETLLKDTIGGFDNFEYFNDQTLEMVSTPCERSKSSYMLFYKKRYWKVRNVSNVIDPRIIDAVMCEIQQNLFKAVSVAPEYLRLVLEVSDADSDGTFLYKSLMTYTTSENLTIETAAPLVNKFINYLHNSRALCEFVLSMQQDTDDLLIQTKNAVTRNVYSQIIVEALKGAQSMKQDLYIETIITKFITNSNMITSSWDHLTELFYVIGEVIDLDTEESGKRFFEVLLNFIRIDIPQFSATHPNDNIIATIDASKIFEILTKNLANQERTQKISEMIFKLSFFETWLKPYKHCFAFIKFISTYIGDSEDVSQMLDNMISFASGRGMTKLMVSALLTLSIFLSPRVGPRITDHILRYTSTKESGFSYECIDEVCQRIISCNMNTKPEDLRKIISFLTRLVVAKSKQIRNIVENFINVILPKQGEDVDPVLKTELLGSFHEMYALFPVVLKRIDEARQISPFNTQYAVELCPLGTYFYVFRKIVDASDALQYLTVSGKFLVKAMLEFSQFERREVWYLATVYDFILSTIKDSEAFFSSASFKDFIQSLSYFFDSSQSVRLNALLRFIPDREFETFINSECFEVILAKNITDDLVDLLMKHMTPENSLFISKLLWTDRVVNSSFRTSSANFFILSWKILEKFHETANIFYSNNLHFKLYIPISSFNVPTTRPALKVLSAFNEAFLSCNKNAKTLFGNKVEILAKEYIKEVNIDFFKVVDSLSIMFPDKFAITGVADFLLSLSRLSDELRDCVFSAIVAQGKPLLQMSPPFLHKSIAKLLFEICDAKYTDYDASLTLVASELKWAGNDCVEDIAFIYYFLHNETGATVDILNSIDIQMCRANSSVVYRGTVSRIALSLVEEAGNEMIEKWVKRAAEVASESATKALHEPIGDNSDLFLSVLDFLRLLKGKVTVTLPSLNLSKNEFIDAKEKEEDKEKKIFLERVIKFINENENDSSF